MQKLKNTTKICKVCFEEIKENSFHNFLLDQCICYSCLKKMNPIFKNFKIDGIKGLSIFNYNDFIKKLIYQYKGCGDYELKDIFISPFVKDIKILFRNYYVLLAPSSKKRLLERGFDHTFEIFKCLNLKNVSPIEKINDDKQSSKSYIERLKVKDSLILKEIEVIKNKKILICDDICTTGSTLKAITELVKKGEPKDIKILVVAKRDFSKKELEQLKDPSFVLN